MLPSVGLALPGVLSDGLPSEERETKLVLVWRGARRRFRTRHGSQSRPGGPPPAHAQCAGGRSPPPPGTPGPAWICLLRVFEVAERLGPRLCGRQASRMLETRLSTFKLFWKQIPVYPFRSPRRFPSPDTSLSDSCCKPVAFRFFLKLQLTHQINFPKHIRIAFPV